MNRRIVATIVLGCATLSGRAHATRICYEASDVVGYERCTRYGAHWSVERSPPFRLELGVKYVQMDPRDRTLHGSFGKGQPGSFSYAGSNASPIATWMLELRPSFLIEPWLYIGGELGVGIGHNDLPALTTAEGYDIAPSKAGVNSLSVGGGAVGGFRLPLRRVSVRLEGLLGGRAASVSQQAASKAHPIDRSASVLLQTWVIEPRLALEAWLTPWLTLGSLGGLNVLGLHDRSVGIALGYHGRAYDGAYR